MKLHEYQAKQLLAQRGVTVPVGSVVSTPEEARAAAQRILDSGYPRVVVKSQIHAGGRGQGIFRRGFKGGVKVSPSPQEVYRLAESMLGQVLVTAQTGPEGRAVRRLLIEGASTIRKEFYLAVLMDDSTMRPIVLASPAGGMNIEEIAARMPDQIKRESVDPAFGLMPYQARKQAIAIGLAGELVNSAARLFQGVYRTWSECDASLVEINPLALVDSVDGGEALVAIDAKMTIDDNGLFRHPEIREMRDLAEEAPLEIEASDYHLNYIKLDGNIACLVNGAGLAMATMDIIEHFGGRPANFLDVGGGASTEQVAAAFKIILQDPNVKAIFVNIFGGIMDCDVIAQGIVAAARETELTLPLVVRLEGNNVEAGRQRLAESGLKVTAGDSMADAAEKVVHAVRLAEAGDPVPPGSILAR